MKQECVCTVVEESILFSPNFPSPGVSLLFGRWESDSKQATNDRRRTTGDTCGRENSLKPGGKL